MLGTSAKSYADRFTDDINFNFAMGWCGMGDEVFNGLQVAPGYYGTRPWFNSWQLELSYDFINLDRISFYAGIGYESSVFMMNYPWVFVNEFYTPTTLDAYDYGELDEEGLLYLPDGIYETRLVTRYINIPIGFDFNLTDKLSFGFTGIIGINYTSYNTGFKYSCNNRTMPEYYDDMSGYINPVKFDIRAYFCYSHFALFLQIPTVSVLKNMSQDTYPLKVGIMLKF